MTDTFCVKKGKIMARMLDCRETFVKSRERYEKYIRKISSIDIFPTSTLGVCKWPCVLIKAVRNQLVSMYISAWHLHYVFGMEWEELHNSWEEYWAGFPHIDVLMHSHLFSYKCKVFSLV